MLFVPNPPLPVNVTDCPCENVPDNPAPLDGLEDGEIDADGERELDGLVLADALRDADTDGDNEDDGERELDGDTEGDGPAGSR